MRVPISRVRSVTLTSMMFMIPIPPTTSEMTATPASNPVIRFGRGRLGRRDFFLVADGKIVVAPFANVMPLPEQRDDLLLRRPPDRRGLATCALMFRSVVPPPSTRFIALV